MPRTDLRQLAIKLADPHNTGYVRYRDLHLSQWYRGGCGCLDVWHARWTTHAILRCAAHAEDIRGGVRFRTGTPDWHVDAIHSKLLVLEAMYDDLIETMKVQPCTYLLPT